MASIALICKALIAGMNPANKAEIMSITIANNDPPNVTEGAIRNPEVALSAKNNTLMSSKNPTPTTKPKNPAIVVRTKLSLII